VSPNATINPATFLPTPSLTPHIGAKEKSEANLTQKLFSGGQVGIVFVFKEVKTEL
jgi:hypothetical protein